MFLSLNSDLCNADFLAELCSFVLDKWALWLNKDNMPPLRR